MKKIMLIVPFLLVSCLSVEPQQFVGPNGRTAYSMKCSGGGRTLDECYKKSGEVCPRGYTILDRASSVVGVPQYGGGTLVVPQHHLTIECKE